MKNTPVRVRFAPSPTGLMHLGNVRTALMNYLFAQRYNGTFILRIEDTDPQRNFDVGAKHILHDLAWLGLDFQEGPGKEGSHGPYFQSERTALYHAKLQVLEKDNYIYRCFCSAQELEKKRQRQIMLKMPPRYDRACAKLSPAQIAEKLTHREPFIWRMKVPTDQRVVLHDLAHGPITFDLNDFSDFPLTRQDGSATFIFANLVDDIAMAITHVLRGEDHLTNTVCQLVLYQAFNAPVPHFWHLPILFNIDGKKLSKRDFGFSLNDLRNAGYLPQAICNYLAILGSSFEQEIMSLEELPHAIPFDNLKAPGQIKYDVAKLSWINHKWIARLPLEQLVYHSLPFLTAQYPEAANLKEQLLHRLIECIKTDITKLSDIPALTQFYFETPSVMSAHLTHEINAEHIPTITMLVQQTLTKVAQPHDFIETIKSMAQQHKVPLKELFSALRYALTGTVHGMSIADLITLLGADETRRRLSALFHQ